LDVSLHQSLIISGGSWWIFFQSPLAVILLALAALSLTSGTGVTDNIRKWLKKSYAG